MNRARACGLLARPSANAGDAPPETRAHVEETQAGIAAAPGASMVRDVR
jgi:hypothetical protein